MWVTPWNTNYHWWQKGSSHQSDTLNTYLCEHSYGTEEEDILKGDRVRVYLVGCWSGLFGCQVKEGVKISDDRVELDCGRLIEISKISRMEKIEGGAFERGYADI